MSRKPLRRGLKREREEKRQATVTMVTNCRNCRGRGRDTNGVRGKNETWQLMVITHDRYYKKGVWTSEKSGCWKKSPQTQIMDRVLFSWSARWIVCLFFFFAFADIRWKCNIICSHTPCLRIQSSAPNQWQLGDSRRPAKQCVSRHSAPGASSVQPFKHSTLNKRMRCDRVKEKLGKMQRGSDWWRAPAIISVFIYLFLESPCFPALQLRG